MKTEARGNCFNVEKVVNTVKYYKVMEHNKAKEKKNHLAIQAFKGKFLCSGRA